MSFAEGMVKAVAGKLGEKLAKEASLAWNVENDVQFIKRELEGMSAFIMHAEEQQDNHQGVKANWVKDVKEIAHDAEDCIEEFTVEVELQPPSRSGFMCCICELIEHVKSRHRIGSEIRELRARVQEASDRAGRLGFTGNASSSSASAINRRSVPRHDAILVDETKLVGIEEPRNHLIGLLADERVAKLTITAVVGMGGLGKTTLVRKVYDHPRISGGLFQRSAWVTASQFSDTKGILSNLVSQLLPQVISSPEAKTEEQVIRELKDNLKENRYLVVLDDLWSSEAWDVIRLALPDAGNGSRVMVTTRKEEVANACCAQNRGRIHRQKPLSDEQSWELFCEIVFSRPDCPEHLTEISSRILRISGGLPTAIITLGGLLAPKKLSWQEWQMIDNHFAHFSEHDSDFSSITQVLNLSYDDLLYHLKVCFLYLSIFPICRTIRCNRLVRRWMAEGFVSERRGRDTEEVAESYLAEFINSSIIKKEGDGKSCRVPDVILLLAVSKAIKENFVGVLDFHRLGNASTITKNTRHLSVQTGPINFEHSLPRLRSLTMSSIFNRQLLTSSEFRLLRVLDLEDSYGLQNEDLKIVCKFFCLRYLSLRWTEVSQLPDTIGDLQNLETLDIRSTEIITLPHTIANLQNLTYFLAGKSAWYLSQEGTMVMPKGVEMPLGVGLMKALSVLALADANVSFSELRMLTQLRRLALAGLTRESSEQFVGCLAMLSQLRSLSLWSADYNDPLNDISYFGNLLPPQQLQSLKLGGRLIRLPSWIASLNYVAKITLCGSKLQGEDLQVLQNLTSLLLLKLIDDTFTGSVLSMDGGFTNLRELHIEYFTELRCVNVSEWAAPDLEKLHVLSRFLVEVSISGSREHTNIRRGGIQTRCY